MKGLEFYNQNNIKKLKPTIKGLGKNTTSLVDSVEDILLLINQSKKDSIIDYGKIFVIFDRDSFPKVNFNEAIYACTKRGYQAIWSNECFELWYILHFELFQSAIPRKQYFEKMKSLFGERYDKTKDYFPTHLVSRLDEAIRNARFLADKFENEKSFALCNSCTMVYDLEILYVNKA